MSDDILGADQSTPTAYLHKGEATTLAPGTIIQGRYEINRVIGIGGMGAVYRVRDLRFKDAVKWDALKEMIIKFADNLDQQTRMRNFEREANLLASLNHPLIPKVNDFFAEANRAYLVLDYIQGKNLEDVLMETTGFLDEALVGGWAIQICEVLHYLHSFRPLPIIFRDLKPSNVMLTPQNQTMLIDFGIAKIIQPDRRDTMIGTEGYSPPEQYKGYVDPRSDIYALGAMLHQLLTASDPRLEAPFTWNERPPRQLNPAISPEMEMIIMKCLAYHADQRWQSAQELKAALEHALNLVSLTGTGQLLRIPTPSPEPAAPPSPNGNGHHANTSGAPPATQPRVTTVFREAGGPRFDPQKDWQPAVAAAPSAPVFERADLRRPTLTYGQVSAPIPSPPVLWSFKTEEEVRSSPILAHNTIYVGSYDFNLYALDAGTGGFKWKFATDGGICCTPASIGDLIIVGSEDHQVYAINGQTGDKVWNYHTGNPVRSSPRVAQDLVVVGSDDGAVHALELRNGRQVWKFKTWRAVRSSPAYHQGVVYIGSDDEHVYAIDLSTGQEKWKFATQYSIISAPAIGDGLIYVGSMDGILYGLDMSLGWPAWKHRTNNFLIASPTVSEGRVYIGSVDRYFYCLDARTGRQIWKYQAAGQIASSAAVSAGYVYFGCSDGAVYCLDARNGQVRWKFQTDGPVPSSPLVRDGILYIGSNDHHVYAVRCAL
jgi:outer membrane protein assembly factor BamB/tRNA A-37 threonylcarbamoyl transferase component Bud32